MAFKTYPIDPELQRTNPSTRKCACGCQQLTHVYRDPNGDIREAKYTQSCRLRKRTTGKPPGRPELPPFQKRNQQVLIRLTIEEKERATDLAAELNLSLNSLIVRLVTRVIADRQIQADRGSLPTHHSPVV